MSQPPPGRGFQPISNEPQPKMNVPAVVSLVLGLASFCLPVITGVLAVMFGAVGVRRSRDANAGGRGPAIAGLVLGLISTVLWLAILVPVSMTWVNSRPQKAMAAEFIADLSHRDINAADKLSAITFGRGHMEDLSDRLNAYGDFREVKFNSYVYSVVNGLEQWTLTGDAYYTKDYAPFTLITIRQQGEWRVYRLILSHKVKAINPLEAPPAAGASSQPSTRP